MFSFLFFGIPIILIILFCICLGRYISAKKQNKLSPDTFSDTEIKKRKNMLIVLSVIVCIFAAIVIFFITLLSMAVANM